MFLPFQNKKCLFHPAQFYLLKVLLFFLGVGVIKAHNELAFEGELVVLVKQSSFGMANVQIADHNKDKAQCCSNRPRAY